MNTAGKLTIAVATLSMLSYAYAETNLTIPKIKNSNIEQSAKKLDYLEKLFGGILSEDKGTTKHDAKKEKKIKTVITFKNGERIATDKKLSLVLLSFEKEAQLRRQRLAEIKRKKEEAKRRNSLKKRTSLMTPPSQAKKTKSFPTLQEQMDEFKKKMMVINVAKANNSKKTLHTKTLSSQYFGTICSGNKCYLLGRHQVYKVGDKVGDKKIMEITTDYVLFNKGRKEWFTR